MEFTVVGCSGSVSGPDSPASSYLVQAPYEDRTFTLVLDLGPGAFGALYRYLDPSQVDAFGFSHLHPDHCFDLCAYFIAARYSPTAPWPAQPVYGPPGTADRIGRAYEVLQPDGGGETATADIASISITATGPEANRSAHSWSVPSKSSIPSRHTRSGSRRPVAQVARWSIRGTPARVMPSFSWPPGLTCWSLKPLSWRAGTQRAST